MPFGPYSDFADCVKRNADKASPEAFCAWLEHETTGNWPGELSHTHGMAPALRETFLSAFNDRMKHGVGEVAALAQAHAILTEAGWQLHNGAWAQVAQHASLKSVRNVEIFKAGTWNGDTYSVDDLRRMVSAFAALHGRIDPPLKLGHSSDAFNQGLALKMGVPADMLTGERGKGAIALGWVESLRLDGDTLLADFAYVPAGIAELIEQRAYRKISSEIMYNVEEDGVTYARVLAGVALLGAEIPAVSQIAGLETAAVYTASREVQMVAEFDSHEPVTQEDIQATLEKLEAAVEPIIKNAKGAPTFRSFWKELMAKFKSISSKKTALAVQEHAKDADTAPADGAAQEDDSMDEHMKQIAKMMGMGDDAKPEDVVAAVGKMMGGAKKPDAEMAKYTALEAENKTYAAKIAELEAEVKAGRRAQRVAHYTAQATKWTHLAGKPEEFAERLVKLEEASKDEAEKLVAEYDRLDAQAAAAFKPVGTPAQGDPVHEFEQKFRKLMADEHLSEAEAYGKVMKADPVLERDYRKQNRAAPAKEAS